MRMPYTIQEEGWIIGKILEGSVEFSAFADLTPNDFGSETHGRIFRRMKELYGRGDRIDRVTVANELMRYGELEACGGLSYLVAISEGEVT